MWMSHAVSVALVLIRLQEGYLAKYAVNEEDREAAEEAQDASTRPPDPMQGLEQLDVAGPKPE